MQYLVMECHPAYVILLDEQGRFVRAANRGYEVGQRVTQVLLMEEDASASPQTPSHNRLLRRVVGGLAACLCLAMLGLGALLRSATATVELHMGPTVALEVNRQGEVVDMTPLNEEGKALLEAYIGTDREVQTLCRELVALSIEQGYASPEEGCSLTVNATEESWGHQLKSSLWQQMATLTDTTILVLPVPGR